MLTEIQYAVPGETFLMTMGEYSDFSMLGAYICRKPFFLDDIISEIKSRDSDKREWRTEQNAKLYCLFDLRDDCLVDEDIQSYLIHHKFIELIKFNELYIGSGYRWN